MHSNEPQLTTIAESPQYRPMNRSLSKRAAHRSIVSVALVGLLVCAAFAARGDKPPPPPDPIIIPDNAVAVDHVTLSRNQKWIPLNRRMLLAQIGTKDFLFVFDQTCAPLMRRDVIISTVSHVTADLYAGTDVLYVNDSTSGRMQDAVPNAINATGYPCKIDHMYSVLDEDVKALRKQLKE